MPSIFFSLVAQNDLREIWEYVFHDSPVAAEKLLNKIEATIDKLAQFPDMGHLREDLTSLPVRFLVVNHYLIVYRNQVNQIEIVRILSGFRDIACLLESLGE